MNDTPSDALVFFGATGDLAYKMIFPALQAMVARGHLDVHDSGTFAAPDRVPPGGWVDPVAEMERT